MKLRGVITLLVALMLTNLVIAQTQREPLSRWNPVQDIISISDGYTINVYTPSFALIHSMVVADPLLNVVAEFALQWSPDGTKLALRISSDLPPDYDYIQIWDAASGTNMTTISNIAPGSNFAWRHDGLEIAAVHEREYLDNHVVIYNALTGTLVNDLTPNLHSNGIIQVSWNNPANQILMDVNGLAALNIRTKKQETVVPGLIGSEPIEYSPSGDRMVFVDHNNSQVLQIWQTHPLMMLTTIAEHDDTIHHYVWRGNRIITTSLDGVTKIWDAETLKLENSIETGLVFDLDANHDGSKLILKSQNNGIHIRDAITGEILATFDPDALLITITPSSLIATPTDTSQ